MNGGPPSFDAAAPYYDESRAVSPETLEAVLDVLETTVGGRGHVLEIGVGTGLLALPLHGRGVPVVGIDLSRPMMNEVRRKAGGLLPFPLVEGDATGLPFATAAFGGAYVRWVLHLVPRWQAVVAELCRVVSSGSTIVVDPGGYTGSCEALYVRFLEEVGDAGHPVGLDMHRGADALVQAFESAGATPVPLPEVRQPASTDFERFFTETLARKHSWTWRVPADVLPEAVDRVRTWALDTYGEDPAPAEASLPIPWRAFRMGTASD